MRDPLPMNDQDRDLEDLLARVLDEIDERGAAAIDAACRDRPDLGQRLRARIDDLARLGLVETEGSALPPAIGPWRPLARLGRGGMSVVWLAQHADGRRAALKLLAAPPELAARALARFRREVRAVEGLEHPGIVRLLDAGQHEGRPWYAMEYAPGATLAAVLGALRARGARPDAIDPAAVREVVRALVPAAASASDERAPWPRTWIECCAHTAASIADALGHLHARGIVHRDVKPGNVLLRLDGRAQLFDLGLAQVEGESALTSTGDFAGTPFYVSPEQARGERGTVDARSDVWSLGATLYELLTLRRPFEGSNGAQVLLRIQAEEPPAPSRIAPHVPRDLETICLTALAKEPARRYASASELADDLRRFLSWQPVRARPIGALTRALRFTRRRPAAAAAIALAATIAVGLPLGLLWSNARIRGERDRAAESAREAERQAGLRQRAAEFLTDLFHAAGGEGTSARDLLETGAREVQSSFEDQPLARAQMLEALGRGYLNLGEPEQALPLFDRCFALRQRELGEDHVDTARALIDLGRVQMRLGRAPIARAIFERSLAALESAAGRSPEWARGAIALAEAHVAAQAPDRGRVLLVDALAALRAAGRSESTEAAAALEQLGRLELARGAAAEASAWLESALAVHDRSWKPDLAARARVLDDLARCADARADAASASDLRAQATVLRAPRIDAAIPWSERDAWALVAAFELAGRREWRERFQSGITALQARDHAGAASAFEGCLSLRPDDSAAAYNLACARLGAGDIDGAFEAMQRAAGHGLAHFADRVEALRRDPDVAALRADPRWPALDARIERAARDGRAWAAEPAWSVPEGAPPERGWPLLVLLHADGSSKEHAARGPWAALAREERWALLVPAARYASAEDPRAAGAWLSDVDDLARRPWRYVEPALDDVHGFVGRPDIDRGRVFAVGEGSGAPVAFEMACRASGLFRGVALIGGAPHVGLAQASAPAAAALGLRVAVLIADGSGAQDASLLLERGLRRLGFACEAGTIVLGTPSDWGQASRAAALRALGPN